MILGQFVSAATLFAKFYAGARKSLSDFRPPLLEQPMKLVSNFGIVVYHNTIFSLNFIVYYLIVPNEGRIYQTICYCLREIIASFS